MGKSNFVIDIFKDLLKCIKISVIVSFFLAIIGAIVSLFSKFTILQSINEALFLGGSIPFVLAAVSFVWPNSLLRPLSYKNEWKKHFRRFNIGFVFLFIGITIYILAIFLYDYLNPVHVM